LQATLVLKARVLFVDKLSTFGDRERNSCVFSAVTSTWHQRYYTQ